MKIENRQRALAIDSLAVTVRNSRNGKNVLPIRPANERCQAQHQKRMQRTFAADV